MKYLILNEQDESIGYAPCNSLQEIKGLIFNDYLKDEVDKEYILGTNDVNDVGILTLLNVANLKIRDVDTLKEL